MNKEDDLFVEDENLEIPGAPRDTTERKLSIYRKHLAKHMKLFPELYRSDVSIHPSYTDLKVLPYHVVCRQRVQRLRRQISRQLNREITHFAMLQMFALDAVRIDRLFSIGMSPKMLIVPDPLTEKERRQLNELVET
ncbi:uncharacterized protein LOC126856817 [Cataglyphis hispanica]|uniref:uncharacterized protein LOC126856817 n=1 Tax=Cataglyphis hispanica TaxID=1086592 RepID=UPI00217FA6CA|nr:uncharacterized protein LOC126856817 [Cataglyphis hispanica]